MSRTATVLTGLATLAVMVGNMSAPQAETVRIPHYTHQGCTIDGRQYLPSYADTGDLATFNLPQDRRGCLDMVARGQVGCEWAKDFSPTNPDGHPWAPGEKDRRCINVFRDEIPRCIEHYEDQKSKCEGSKRESRRESSDCGFAKQTFDGYKSACKSGNQSVCELLPQASAIVEQTCS